LLDRLGLTVTAQFVGVDHTVLACRVVEPEEITERSCCRAPAKSVNRPVTCASVVV